MPSRGNRRRPVVPILPVVALLGYAVMWVGYRQGWSWLDAVDSSALKAGYDIGIHHPDWVRFWEGLCTLFAPVAFRVVGMVVTVLAVIRRHLRTAVFVLASVEMTGVLTTAAKGLADRPRPDTALAFAPSSSFPSGHALGAMVGVAALLTVMLPLLRVRARAVAVVLGAAVVVAVGFGRVALNVHHPSDVLAGWALGYLYFLLCLRVIRLNGGRPRLT